jgi:hypothetical protein
MGRVSVERTDSIPPWAVTALKWAAAVLAFIVLVNYAVPRVWTELQGAIVLDTGDDDDDLPEVDAAATEATAIEEGQVVAVSDLATANGTITGRTAETVAIGFEGADQLLIGFDRVPADPACLTEVTLEVFLADSSGAELVVRPGVLPEITELEDGQALPPSAIIEGSTSGSAIAAAETSGWLRWGVLGPYTLADRSASSDSLVVLSIAPHADADAGGSATLATTDGPEETYARLTWTAVDPCSDLGRGGGVAEEDPALSEEAADAGAEDNGE